MSDISHIIHELFSRYSRFHFDYHKLLRYLSYIAYRYSEPTVFDLSYTYIMNHFPNDPVFKSFKKDYKLSLEKRKLRESRLIVDKDYLSKYHFVHSDTIGDGSCFFHSVLMGISDNTYNTADTKERINIVKNLRRLLSQNITLEQWENLNEGKLAISEICQFLRSKFGYNNSFTEFLFNVQLESETLHGFISSLREHKFARKIIVHLNDIKNHLFENYKERLSNPSVWVGTDEGDVDAINLFADFLGIDIYIFSMYKKMPYVLPYHSSFSYTKNHKKRPSVFLLNINNTHFESMGIVQKDKRGELYVKRFFSANDIVVKKLYSIITGVEDCDKYHICYGCKNICEIHSQVCSVCMRNGNYVYVQ